MKEKIDNTKLIDGIEIELLAILGKSSMSVRSIKEIEVGSVIPLNKDVNDAIDIYANNKLIARGEILPSEGSIGVKITEVLNY